jgi:hypothetical protein
MYVTNHEMNGEPISEAPSIVVAHTRIIFTQPTENKPEQEKHYKHCVYIYIYMWKDYVRVGLCLDSKL